MASYTLSCAMPAVAYDLLLPKKAAYQGALYDALTGGLQPDVVRAFVRAHADEVIALLARQGAWSRARIEAATAEDAPVLLRGYSLSEVDGVYAGEAGLAEERTQVIRFVFLPPYDLIAPGYRDRDARTLQPVRNFVRAFIAREAATADSFVEDHARRFGGLPDGHEALLATLAAWHDRVELFVFGYVLLSVARIAREEEIWVSSGSPVWINRVTDRG